MPFASPFGAMGLTNFNPAFSNVPQNKPPAPVVAPPKPKPEPMEMPSENSVVELNSMTAPKIFAGAKPESVPEPAAMPSAPVPEPMSYPQMPPVMPVMSAPPYPQPMPMPMLTPGESILPEQMPELPQRLNPNRLVFV